MDQPEILNNIERKVSQKKISFPARPEEINREMLSPLNAHATEDSDG